MRLDIVIANPPYNRWKLHTKIANYIKLKTIRSVFIMPINVDIKYKTFTPKHVSKYAINKLWEIYNERGNK